MAKIYYRLYQIDRIGQLYDESFCIKNLYKNDEIIFIVPKITQRVNIHSLTQCLKDCKVYETEDESFVSEAHTKILKDDLAAFQDGYIYTKHPSYLTTQFRNKYRNISPEQYHIPSDGNEDDKNKILNEFNIDSTKKIVTLHIRESGYLQNLKYHSYRNMNIEKIRDSIEYLTESGYYVIRLGDPSMTSLEYKHGKYIDLTKSEYFNTFAESYFIGLSLFHVGTVSGPFSIAQTMGIPILAINQERPFTEWGGKYDFDLPRNYYSVILKRNLTFSEIINSQIYNFYDIKQYEKHSLKLIENNSLEILESIKEILEKINNKNNKFKNMEVLNYYEDCFNYKRNQSCKGKMQYKNIPSYYLNNNRDYFGQIIS